MFSSGMIPRSRLVSSVLCCLAVVMLLCLTAPASSPIESDTANSFDRLRWFDLHTAMKETSPFKDIPWRFIGPDIISGRCTDIAVPKGSKHIIYVGSATGGLWKTKNSGITWEPIMDNIPAISIGDIAISPTQPEVIWVGTGEANIFRASIAGTGIYKSMDAGQTWTHMGLTATHTIARIVIHPKNPDVLYLSESHRSQGRNRC